MKVIITALTVGLLGACGGTGGAKAPETVTAPTTAPVVDPVTTPAVELSDTPIRLNQLGYLPDQKKMAIVPNTASTAFEVVSVATGAVVFDGTLSQAFSWDLAGVEQFKQADFSSLVTSGTFILKIEGVNDSSEFEINTSVYAPLHDAALKYYYLNRSSSAIIEPYAEGYVRAAGHVDEEVKVHASAATALRPESTIISSPKGWYDAGDYGKYVVNSGISTYTLLAAYEHFPTFYAERDGNIPESNDSVPDILNEALWNIEWLATMQDLDGSVYHKLTTLDWPGQEMPDEDTRDRYVIGKSTSAALNFAAVMSMASRVYQPFESSFPGKSAQWLAAAEAAWGWAINNTNQPYQQPADVNSGAYGDSSFDDEFAWAAAELFITTKKATYFEKYTEKENGISVPSWPNVSYLATSSLLLKGQDDINPTHYQTIKDTQLTFANSIVTQYENNHYGVAMQASDFVWGSNSVVLNKALVLLQAYRLSEDDTYKQVAIEHLNYILGRNPTDYSFVTGFGDKTPMDPHHRISFSDGISAPIPGMLVGGAYTGRQDGCSYPHLEVAKSYIDDWCSFSTNEVTINWNAPLVYVLAAIQSEQ